MNAETHSIETHPALARRLDAERLTWVVVALGVGLRILHVAGGRSLWHDEAMVALNILDRGFLELLEPLSLNQAAPVGYLWSLEISTRLLGNGEAALRLPALLASIVALVVFRGLALRTLDRGGALLATTLLAVGAPMVYYAAEVKPYSVDLAVAVVLFYLAVRWLQEPDERRWPAALMGVGAVAQLFSFTTVFVLAGVGTVLFLTPSHRRHGRNAAWLIGSVALWLAVFGALYVALYAEASDNSFLNRYWIKGFVPWSEGAGEVLGWALGKSYLFAVVVGTSLIPGLALAAFAAFGWATFAWERGRALAFLLVSPVIVAFVVSGLGFYPLEDRLAFYLAPIGVLLLAHAASTKLLPRWITAGLAAVLVLTGGRRTLNQMPFEREEFEPLLAELLERHEPHQAWFATGLTRPAIRYYGHTMTLPDYEVARSGSGHGDRGALDVETVLANGETWLISSHSYPDSEGRDALEVLGGRLRDFGTFTDSLRTKGTRAYLFERRDTVAGR